MSYDYETDPAIVADLNDEDYAALLESVWNAPLPRKVVRIDSRPRKLIIRALLDQGLSRKEVSARLNLSICLISLILSGKRN